MPPAPKLRVGFDFFRVEVDPANKVLPILIDTIYASRPNVPDRNLPVEDGFVRIYNWHDTGKVNQGAVLRLRTANVASVGRLSTDQLTDLNLGNDEALTEFFCFSYFPSLAVLLVHRNRDAGRHGRLTNYLEQMISDVRVQLNPILNLDATQRLTAMKDVTVAEMKIAVPEVLAQQEGKSVGEMIDFAKRTGATTITAKVSMEHSKKPLKAGVKEVWENAVKALGHNVQSATVRGRVEDEIVVVDLIADRMKETVDIDAPSGRLTLQGIWSAAQVAFERRLPELEAQFQK